MAPGRTGRHGTPRWAMIDRLARLLYLATLALLPWGTIVGFPWLHENAQWSDVLFALAAALWAAGVVASPRWPRLRLVHAGLGLYLGWAALSLLAADPRPASGPAKLLGVAMLVALMVVTSELARRSGMPRAIGLTVAITSVLAAKRERARGSESWSWTATYGARRCTSVSGCRASPASPMRFRGESPSRRSSRRHPFAICSY